jgi:hypothetical protein
MDPVSMSIVTALAGGAAVAAKDVATSAVKDAYSALKKLIIDRYAHVAPLVEAVATNPGSAPAQQALAAQLHGAESDTEARDHTVALLNALETSQRDSRAPAILSFNRLRAAKNFEISDVEFSSGTLLEVKDSSVEGDIKISHVRQSPVGQKSGN